MPDLLIASLIDDLELVEAARVDAFAIVSGDPHLDSAIHGPLLRQVKRTFNEAWEWVSSG
jgi:hypothetical protein